MSEGLTKVIYTHPNGNKLIRGKRPDWRYSSEFGNIGTIINLETGWFEFFHHKEARERELAKRAGMSYYSLPLSNFRAPTIREVEMFLALTTNALNYSDVYFHCLHGQDRTGYMCAAYRILKQKWNIKDAIDEMLEMGFHTFPYASWIENLKDLK